MINFSIETLEALHEAGYTPADVMFIGSRDGKLRMSWQDFETYGDFDYDNDYGLCEIAEDVIVYFNEGSWLERASYAGKEWWHLVKIPTFKPTDPYQSFTKFVNHHYIPRTLRELNELADGSDGNQICSI